MTPYAPAQQAYRDSSVLTAPPERLVVMLYDGAHRFLFQAAHAMRSGDITLMNNRMQRAEAIVNELRSTLNFEQGGEIAVRLDSIYSFCQRHMLDARLKLDPARIEQVMKLLADLRDAWDQVAAKS
ncbi:MAG: flagellar secretion chaperone FliS [Thermoleophilaceae bacterium]|jgi:flagellar protein FliS|nr:flagellar secretion chaperone FliS [Thermoleophilaceae bacterium]